MTPYESARTAIPEHLKRLAGMLTTAEEQRLYAHAAAQVTEHLKGATALVVLIDAGAGSNDPLVQQALATNRRTMNGIRDALGRSPDRSGRARLGEPADAD